MSFDLGEEEANGVKLAVNRILQGIYNAEGIYLWWERPRHQLDGKTPDDVLRANPVDVVDLALGALEQGGA